jgi:hypothetical protein
VGTGKNERAVVDYSELKKFLTNHISEVEKAADQDSDPEDLAEEFLDFVKERAGLLMEVGDNRYSFIHLTFQEYLASSCINRRGETEGVFNIWEIIKGNCGDARWHEVIRLLIAGLRADKSREILVEKILEETSNTGDIMHSLLVGGLLLDGIEAAEYRQEEILYNLFESAIETREDEMLKLVLDRVRTWIGKEEENRRTAITAFKSLWEDLKDEEKKIVLVLTGFAVGWSEAEIHKITGKYLHGEDENAELLRIFMCEVSGVIPSPPLKRKLEILWAAKDFYSLGHFSTDIVSVALQAVEAPLETSIIAERIFVEQLTLLSSRSLGSLGNHILISLKLFARKSSEVRIWARDMAGALNMACSLDRTKTLDKALSKTLDPDKTLAQVFGSEHDSSP